VIVAKWQVSKFSALSR